MAKTRTRKGAGKSTATERAARAKQAASRRRLARARTARFGDILSNEPPRPVAARVTFDSLRTRAETRSLAAPMEAAGLTFVAAVTVDGPWELRSLVVNDFQILDKTIPLTDLRVDVPIPAVFSPPLAVNWSILAGHTIPGLATFIAPAGGDPVKLAEKAPLKKGESWTPPSPSAFP